MESVGIATLHLIVAEEETAISQGKKIITRVRQEFLDIRQQQELLQLIETILVYKLPQVSRQEIEAMFSLSALKQTRVYQEALEEGRQEGRQEGQQEGKLQAKLESVPRLVALGLSLEQIAEALELSPEQVRQANQSVQEN